MPNPFFFIYVIRSLYMNTSKMIGGIAGLGLLVFAYVVIFPAVGNTLGT